VKSSVVTGFFFIILFSRTCQSNILHENTYILKYLCNRVLTKSADGKPLGRKQVLMDLRKKEKVKRR